MVEQDKKDKKENLAIIRVRGLTGVKPGVKDALSGLRLYKKNYCVVVPKNESYLGIVNKIKDYITWGEIDNKTQNELTEKRMEEYKGRVSDANEKIKYNKFAEANGKKIKKVFRLNSPRKGYGRKGIKVPFKSGGALGYRGSKINDLIKRMI